MLLYFNWYVCCFSLLKQFQLVMLLLLVFYLFVYCCCVLKYIFHLFVYTLFHRFDVDVVFQCVNTKERPSG